MKLYIEKTLLVLFLLVFLTSCLALDTKDEGEDDQIIFDETQEIFIVEDETPLLNEETITKDSFEEEITLDLSESGNNNVSITEDIGLYNVEKGDTLMWIAFKLYGDYSQWRKIYELNKDTIKPNYDLSLVASLRYHVPDQKFINPTGRPYFIKRGDSLSKISKKVYGQWQKWPIIYKNNSAQIKDPNLIFAGFTLFYKPLYKNNLF